MKIRHTGNTYSKNSSTLITRYSESASHQMSACVSVVNEWMNEWKTLFMCQIDLAEGKKLSTNRGHLNSIQ